MKNWNTPYVKSWLYAIFVFKVKNANLIKKSKIKVKNI